jgi:hypothetical protein
MTQHWLYYVPESLYFQERNFSANPESRSASPGIASELAVDESPNLVSVARKKTGMSSEGRQAKCIRKLNIPFCFGH